MSRFVEVPAVQRQELDSYQAQNKITAYTAYRELLGLEALSETEAYDIMDKTVIPGRMETVYENPLVIIDAAHNPASAQMLAQTLKSDKSYRPLCLLLAILSDKDARGIIQALAPYFEEIVATQTSSSRALPASTLASLVEEETGRYPGTIRTFTSSAEALTELLKQETAVVATGSITLAGEVKDFLSSKQG